MLCVDSQGARDQGRLGGRRVTVESSVVDARSEEHRRVDRLRRRGESPTSERGVATSTPRLPSRLRRPRRADEDGTNVDSIRRPLVLGSAKDFGELFDPTNDRDEVICDLQRARVSDHSAIDALAECSQGLGKVLHLRHLSPECRRLPRKAGNLVEVNMIEDPRDFVATDDLA